MSRGILASIFIFFITEGLYGQWYNKKYFVNDINLLNQSQLTESLDETRGEILGSGGFALIGGALIWGGSSTIKNGLDEDASIIEELLGAEFIGRSLIVLGAGCIAGGTIGSLIFFTRHEKIRSVLKNNYGPPGSLGISPALIPCRNDQPPALGMSVWIKF